MLPKRPLSVPPGRDHFISMTDVNNIKSDNSISNETDYGKCSSMIDGLLPYDRDSVTSIHLKQIDKIKFYLHSCQSHEERSFILTKLASFKSQTPETVGDAVLRVRFHYNHPNHIFIYQQKTKELITVKVGQTNSPDTKVLISKNCCKHKKLHVVVGELCKKTDVKCYISESFCDNSNYHHNVFSEKSNILKCKNLKSSSYGLGLGAFFVIIFLMIVVVAATNNKRNHGL